MPVALSCTKEEEIIKKPRRGGVFRDSSSSHVFPHAAKVVAQEFAFAFVEIFERRFFGLNCNFVHMIH